MLSRPQLVVTAIVTSLFVSPPAAVTADQPDSFQLTVRIGSVQPVAARIQVVDSEGQIRAPAGLATRTTTAGVSYFYADGSFEISLPRGNTTVRFWNGLEYIPQTRSFELTGDRELVVDPQRWVNMSGRGWYSGDSHVHLHTGGPIPVTVADALLAARAEGVNFVNLCASNNVGDDLRDADQITGKPHELSTSEHLLVFGEEMRSSIYGHMQFLGIRELVEPQYTGFNDTPNHFDFPANHELARKACRQGAVVTYAHPMFKDQPFPFSGELTANSGAARELPIDAMLNVVQAIDLMSYNSDEPQTARLWYRLLNCGLKLAACVGTDALLDRSTDPLGGSRVYVRCEDRLSMRGWLDGLASGRTFVTNGPMIDLQVETARPGDTLTREPGDVRVRAIVESHVPFTRIQIIVNGQVLDEQKFESIDERSAVQRVEFESSLPLTRSSWIALRVEGDKGPRAIRGQASSMPPSGLTPVLSTCRLAINRFKVRRTPRSLSSGLTSCCASWRLAIGIPMRIRGSQWCGCFARLVNGLPRRPDLDQGARSNAMSEFARVSMQLDAGPRVRWIQGKP